MSLLCLQRALHLLTLTEAFGDLVPVCCRRARISLPQVLVQGFANACIILLNLRYGGLLDVALGGLVQRTVGLGK